ncbi:MAG: HD domain-containing protein [Nanoarchaeota archaeon]
MKIPTEKECYDLLEGNNVPTNILDHSVAVLKVSVQIYDQIKDRFELDSDIIKAAALLHDIEKLRNWHEIKGKNYLKLKGYKEIGNIVGEHGMVPPPASVYGKILFYADKRVNENEIVSLRQRLDFIKRRYKLNMLIVRQLKNMAKQIEKELGIQPDKIK